MPALAKFFPAFFKKGLYAVDSGQAQAGVAGLEGLVYLVRRGVGVGVPEQGQQGVPLFALDF